MKQAIYLGLCLLLLAACGKDNDKPADSTGYTNRLNFIIDDNKFNFSYFNTGLGRTPYRVTLSEEGPYTILLPDNNAFIKAGYSTEQAVLTESGSVLNNIIAYHVTTGIWDLKKLPFKFNQEIQAITGGKMYVTRWVKNGDTITTINGTRVLSYNLTASNGLIQVLDAVLEPLLHNTLMDAISSNNDLTYLAVALRKAGMSNMLQGEQVYTFFAPNNAAFVAANYPTIEAVEAADPAVLKALLTYNCFEGRKFIYDYILTTGATDRTEQAMQSGSNITINLLSNGVNYTGISVRGIGNTAAISITRGNVLAGNGVMHITTGILKQNQ